MARLTPLDIRKVEFKQSALGYGKEQVSQYLESVADELEALIRENSDLAKENARLLEKLSSYRNVEQSMNEALVMAKDSAKKTVQAAQKEAEIIVQKGNVEKDALLFSAKEELRHLQRDIHTLRLRRDGILLKLRTALQNHLDVLIQEFQEDEEDDLPHIIKERSGEKIIDFSQTDVSIEELEAETTGSEMEDEKKPLEPEIENFSEGAENGN